MGNLETMLAKFFDSIPTECNEDECWEWQGALNGGERGGYGTFYLEGKTELAHRLSYEIANGPIKGKLVVMHECDNRCCVNPNHLHVGTTEDNVRDMIAKGRAPWQQQSKETLVKA